MTVMGETTTVAPKEQTIFVNLSGKKTFTGRNSGERLRRSRPPKKQADGYRNPYVKLSGLHGQRLP